jgi:glycosyltransferase involved in cell wall biosynthesis
MKILFLLTQDIESPSGLGRYFPLAKELAKRGHSSTIAALHPRFKYLDAKRFTKEGVEVWYVGQMHVQKQGNEKTYFSPSQLLRISLQGAWALSKAALAIPADIIHVGKPHPMNSLAGLIARLLQNKRLILDCDDYEAGSGHFSSSSQKWIIQNFERRVPRHVHAVTTNTSFMRQKLISWGVSEEKIYYLPNGVERSRFVKPDPQRILNLRNQLNLKENKVVTFVGSLSLANHAVDLLIEAFALLHANRPNTKLFLVGSGEDYDRLHQQATTMGLSDEVIFTGRIPPDQVTTYYYLSDVSVDPVRDDEAARGRSPLKLFESWACGVPFVSADVGDRKELAGSPSAALLAPPGDFKALSLSIQKVLDDPATASNLSRNGSERVNLYFWDLLVEQAIHVYQDTQYDPSILSSGGATKL